MSKSTKKVKQSQPPQPHRILEVKTSQTSVLKQVFERISTVISDCCIVFIPPDKEYDQKQDDDYYEEVEQDAKPVKRKKKGVDEEPPKRGKNVKKDEDDDEPPKKGGKTSFNTQNAPKASVGGIRILRLTEDKSILIKLNLDSDKFDSFKCTEPKITIGVDINNLHAMLKSMNDDDPIMFYMNSDNRSTLYVRSLTKNNDNSEETDLEIYLMDISNPELPPFQTEFQNKITIASDKFHNICKQFNNNTTYVEITSLNEEISFRGQNDGGKITKTYKDVNKTGKAQKDPSTIVQGVYELKNLLSFSKCNKLCNTVDIYLRNDFPLVLVISVATLGKMYVFLTPIGHGVK